MVDVMVVDTDTMADTDTEVTIHTDITPVLCPLYSVCLAHTDMDMLLTMVRIGRPTLYIPHEVERMLKVKIERMLKVTIERIFL